MICVSCEKPIPAARLLALPNAKQCVRCVEANGDEPPIKGRMIWTGKHAPEIEIGTQFAAQAAKDAKRRGYGPTIRFQAIEGPFGAARQVAAAKEHTEAAALVREVEREA